MSSPVPAPSLTLPEENEEQLSVTFHPPLYLQRRGWVFSIMRREHVREVLDVGCGEAELLACLCNPAPWLPSPPPPPLSSRLSPSQPVGNQAPDPHIRPYLLHALEPHPSLVAMAVAATAPPPSEEEERKRGRLWLGVTRWEELEVRVWRGGLEVVNEGFKGVECIVATEVYVPSFASRSHLRLLFRIPHEGPDPSYKS